jgi:hypothetical protein
MAIASGDAGTKLLALVGVPHALSSVSLRTISGSATVQFLRNGAAIDGFGAAVSATGTPQTIPSDEVFAEGDLLSLELGTGSGGILATFKGEKLP